MQKLLAAVPEDPSPKSLWTLNYSKKVPRASTCDNQSDSTTAPDATTKNSPRNSKSIQSRVIILPELGPDIALEDSVLREVETAWEKIVGEEKGEGFMLFEDRGERQGNDNDEAEDEF